MCAAECHHRAKAQRRQSREYTRDRRKRTGRRGGLAGTRQHKHADRDQELPHPPRNLARYRAVHQRRGEIAPAEPDGCDQPPRQRRARRHEFARIGSPQTAKIEPEARAEHVHGQRQQHS